MCLQATLKLQLNRGETLFIKTRKQAMSNYLQTVKTAAFYEGAAIIASKLIEDSSKKTQITHWDILSKYIYINFKITKLNEIRLEHILFYLDELQTEVELNIKKQKTAESYLTTINSVLSSYRNDKEFFVKLSTKIHSSLQKKELMKCDYCKYHQCLFCKSRF